MAIREVILIPEAGEVPASRPVTGELPNQESPRPDGALPRSFTRPGLGTYAFPWPDALPGLGERHVGPFTRCGLCGSGTWVRYGHAPRCSPCAVTPAS